MLTEAQPCVDNPIIILMMCFFAKTRGFRYSRVNHSFFSAIAVELKFLAHFTHIYIFSILKS